MIVSELETLNKCIADNFARSETWIENVHKIIDNLTDCSRAIAPCMCLIFGQDCCL